MDDYKITVLLDLESSGCVAYRIPRSVCERAVKIADDRGLPSMAPRDYARLAAITLAKADGVKLSPKIKELRDA